MKMEICGNLLVVSGLFSFPQMENSRVRGNIYISISIPLLVS